MIDDERVQKIIRGLIKANIEFLRSSDLLEILIAEAVEEARREAREAIEGGLVDKINKEVDIPLIPDRIEGQLIQKALNLVLGAISAERITALVKPRVDDLLDSLEQRLEA